MAGELVLITGGTGHLGFRTVVEALHAGYRVRASVRNESGIAKVKAAPSVQPYLSRISFVLVPDIIKSDAYNEAVKDVDYIIHLASPIARQKTPPKPSEFEAVFIEPAVKGTMNLIRAAHKYSPTTRRIVVTTSIVAIIPWTAILAETGEVFNEESRTPVPAGPYDGVFSAYSASKVAALAATEEYIAKEKPHFDINSVAPSFTIGKNELTTSLDDILVGTNGTALGIVLDRNNGMTPSTSVHLNDVSRAHVLALSPSVPGNQVYIGVSENSNTQWEDAFDIVKKHFPEQVKDGTFPMKGKNVTKRLVIDNSWTQKALGTKFASYEDQVVSVAEHYLELKAKEGKVVNGVAN